jgi:hypothetical protein
VTAVPETWSHPTDMVMNIRAMKLRKYIFFNINKNRIRDFKYCSIYDHCLNKSLSIQSLPIQVYDFHLSVLFILHAIQPCYKSYLCVKALKKTAFWNIAPCSLVDRCRTYYVGNNIYVAALHVSHEHTVGLQGNPTCLGLIKPP